VERISVLIVDDDPQIRRILRELLEDRPEYEVKIAGEGSQAVRLFFEGRIDIVLTDIHMPGFTGLEVVADMKRLKFQPEILVMTSKATPENVEKARQLGARAVILKPFENLDIIDAEIEKAALMVIAARRRAAPPPPAHVSAPAESRNPVPRGAPPRSEPNREDAGPAPRLSVPFAPPPAAASPPADPGATARIELPELDGWKTDLVGNDPPAPHHRSQAAAAAHPAREASPALDLPERDLISGPLSSQMPASSPVPAAAPPAPRQEASPEVTTPIFELDDEPEPILPSAGPAPMPFIATPATETPAAAMPAVELEDEPEPMPPSAGRAPTPVTATPVTATQVIAPPAAAPPAAATLAAATPAAAPPAAATPAVELEDEPESMPPSAGPDPTPVLAPVASRRRRRPWTWML
jgi:CheY-like chemotaxis protein